MTYAMRARRHQALAMALFFGAVLLQAGSVVAQGVQYVYDDAGRLIAVTDPSGDTAVYEYDAVGNVLSITRSTAAVKILYVSPSSGPVGSSVSVFGTGFSTTPSQNALTFNGTAATITSATASKLVTTVPSGATTGLIGVTTPTGSAVSPEPFTVTASLAPIISSFTPTIGVFSTAVTLSGTNFATTTGGNRANVNKTLAPITSAGATSLAITVPQFVTSGHISVATANGSTVSTDDFYVAPAPYGVADVQVTQRVSLGGAGFNAAITSANKIGLVIFDGVANQRVSVKATLVSGSFGCNWPLRILRVDGSVLGETLACSTNNLLEPQTLPVTGTYTVPLDPVGTNTGTMTVNVYSVVDVTDPITPGGSAVTAALTTPGQNARLPFSGTAGQRMSVKVTMSSGSFGCNWPLRILKSDGTVLGQTTACNGSSWLLEPQTLPTTGTYTVVVDPLGASIGTATVNLYSVVDVTDPITPGGSAVTAALTTPGQNARLPFSGTAGQRMSVKVTMSSGSFGCNWPLQILKSDGTVLGQTTACSGTNWLLEPQTLPTTDTYTVVVDPLGTNTGTATVNLYSVVDVTDPITPGGSAVTVALTTPGQNARLPFSGTAGQRMSVRVAMISGSFGCNWPLQILKPDGTVLGQTTGCNGTSWFLEPLTLPSTGTYTVVVDPLITSTGTATVNLYDVVDVTGPIAINGSAVSVPITVAGQNGRLTFSGTASQVVTVTMTATWNMGGTWTLALLKPDGSTLASTAPSGMVGTLSGKTLPVTGTYTVLINPSIHYTGTVSVTVTSP